MSCTAEQDLRLAVPEPAPKTYHVGTLTYTKASLLILCVWLLWGDFCFILMECVMPSILPLKLTHLGAPNTLIGILITTLFSAMNFFLFMETT